MWNCEIYGIFATAHHPPEHTEIYLMWHILSDFFLALFVIIEKDQGACTSIQHIEFFLWLLKIGRTMSHFNCLERTVASGTSIILFQANKEMKTHARIPRHRIDKTTQHKNGNAHFNSLDANAKVASFQNEKLTKFSAKNAVISSSA